MNWLSALSEDRVMNPAATIGAELASRISSDKFDLAVFREAGVFVLRNAIAAPVMRGWQQEWQAFYDEKLRDGRDVNRANPVSLSEQLPATLARMYHDPAYADTLKQVLGPDVALYNHRFVIKDAFSRDKVFLHQDSCYHLGNLNKCSIFTPLSEVDESNGGMSFHLGSHKLGFLGDAGEINPDSFDLKFTKVTPALSPGDFVIMNSSLWHESGPNISGVNRILADTIFQPADDPTGKELLHGQWQTDIFYSPLNCVRYFKNSRVLRNIKNDQEKAAREAQGAA